MTLVTREGLLPSHNGGVRDLLAPHPRTSAASGSLTDTPVACGRARAADRRRWRHDRIRRGAVGHRGQRRAVACRYRPAARRARVSCWSTKRLRSPADAAVFAAGDIATMPAHPRDKAGVYAVRAGPPLADNLRRALAGRRLRRAVPQKRALALIGTGDGKAVASRGPFAAYGRSLWLLKDWIDRRWMRQIHRTAGSWPRRKTRRARARCAAAAAPPRCRPRCWRARWRGSRPASKPDSLARARQPGRRRDRVVSGRAAAVADRRFLPRDGRRPVSVRAHRGQPCARRHLRDGRRCRKPRWRSPTCRRRARRSWSRICSTC